jgi:hypothetical protein
VLILFLKAILALALFVITLLDSWEHYVPGGRDDVIQKVKKKFGVDISGCYDEPIFKVLDHIESQINTTDHYAPDDYHHA